ncbi:unnamed protein product [Leptidea sinapis]|uniref:PDZ domain-containing protein n=1 Tax=Leptidea sinapis TaxID=189913 RepID=A0A5E4QF81_9NEOP|nr:unnamed protein product [Leptidea sinapis]
MYAECSLTEIFQIPESMASGGAGSGAPSVEVCRRRTIIVKKRSGHYGFTFQSYGKHYERGQDLNIVTYVDHVDFGGTAAAAGLKKGDVIIALNGYDIEGADHETIVEAILASDAYIHVVVTSDNCVISVDLYHNYVYVNQRSNSAVEAALKFKRRERQILDSIWRNHSNPALSRPFRYYF